MRAQASDGGREGLRMLCCEVSCFGSKPFFALLFYCILISALQSCVSKSSFKSLLLYIIEVTKYESSIPTEQIMHSKQI